MYGSEEEGVGGPPAQALGEREQRSRQWIAYLADGDRVKLHLLPFPVRRDMDASFTSCEGGERQEANAVLFRSGEERVRDCEYSKP